MITKEMLEIEIKLNNFLIEQIKDDIEFFEKKFEEKKIDIYEFEKLIEFKNNESYKIELQIVTYEYLIEKYCKKMI